MNFNFIGTLVNALLRRSSNKESEDECPIILPEIELERRG